jgi:hypothetical protein
MTPGSATPETSREAVAALVSRFTAQLSTFKSAAYNETQVRREFIDPLFRALGWDIANAGGAPESLKDVVHEDSLRVSGTSRAPDYSFRIAGRRQFFVEAKRPSIAIATATSPAFQVRRYGWSANLLVSVLTDFEELAIYDCRIPPQPRDSAESGRLRIFGFPEYAEEWDEIYGLLSREAVAQGSLDRLAGSEPAGPRALPIDRAFLTSIENWRSVLAEDIAARNPSISAGELNFAVQTMIDRIVFLRICEARGIEEEGSLARVSRASSVHGRLQQLFRDADARYNSGLFHFASDPNRHERPDVLTPELTIGNEALRRIIGDLENSSYELSVVPAEILGKVYEQFLGQVITRTDTGAVTVTAKPEVRKAGGVYYTPSHISDYLVSKTLGKALTEHPIRARWRPPALRVLDPACGSGSFLLVAYQALLDWYLEAFLDQGPEKHKARLYQTAGGDWRLTSAERKQILTRHIFGVDIDAQAVETTKLSLLLKVLEHESAETIGQNLTLYKERALPDLGDNIKCGNALVGQDFMLGQVGMLDGTSDSGAANPFDWEQEFPDVFGSDAPGFDVVIGNPPYLSYSGRQAAEISPELRSYLTDKFQATGWLTAHGFFIEQAAAHLSKRYVGFIVPAQVGHLDGYRGVREAALLQKPLVEVRYWGEKVFEDAMTPALTFVLDSQHGSDGPTSLIGEDMLEDEVQVSPGAPWTVDRDNDLLERLAADAFFLSAEMVADPGVHTGNVSKKIILKEPCSPDCVPVLEGRRVGRYSCAPPAKWLDLGYVATGDEYFRIRPEPRYTDAHFVVRQTAAFPIVGPRRGASYFRNTLLALYDPADYDIRYIVGLLNSRLMRFAYQSMVQESGQKTFPQVKVGALRKLPLRRLDLALDDHRQTHDRIVFLVEGLLDTATARDSSRVPQEQERAARAFAALDEELDAAIFDLYGLSPDDVARVEKAVPRET